jgi:lysophospholipase L1-like esterase
MAENKKKVLCVGDSLTAGFCNYGFQFFPYCEFLTQFCSGKFDIDHLGYSGWTSEEMINKASSETVICVCGLDWDGIDTKLKKNEPYEFIFLLAGTNDLSSEESLTIIQNLKVLIHKFSKSSNYVGILTIPTMRAEKFSTSIKDTRAEVNNWIRNESEIDTNLRDRLFVVDTDVALPMNEDDPTSMSLWDRDGLHLTAEGSRRIAETVFQAMQQFVER